MAGDHDRMAAGRTRRAVKATTALAPSTTRFFTSLAASLARSPERTAEILEERHIEIADHAAAVLGDLRGGAMKIGQMASFIDVDFLPPEYREISRDRLGNLRDPPPPLTLEKGGWVLASEWAGPVGGSFAEFE